MEEAERLEREAAVAAAVERGQQTARPPRRPAAYPPHPVQQNVPRNASWECNGGSGHRALTAVPSNMTAYSQWHNSVTPTQPYVWPPQNSASSASPGACTNSTFGDSASEILAFTGLDPNSNEQLMRALQSQTAFVDGDPDTKEDLELYYYRLAGSTAIHPGINRISLKLQPRPPLVASAPVPSDQNVPPPSSWPEQIFDENCMPVPSVHLPLLDTFFRTMSQHFPSISKKRMQERLETGTMSAFFMNCICAIAARFHPGTEGRAAEASAPFITKAQELVVPLVHLPAHDTVTGLLLLAWASYGQNSEAALWQYSGMAFRMSADLGLHGVSDLYESRAHVVRTRLLFWSLFITDRIVSFARGRPTAIPEDIIEIPLPKDEDFFPDPARNTDPNSRHELVEPVPFQYLARAMVLCGRISSFLNNQRGRPCTLVGMSESDPSVLSELQTQLVQFYAGLPETMKWSVENFKHQEARGHGGTFLTLHLWTNAVMSLVYHPELIEKSGVQAPLTQAMQRSIRLSLSSARNISECLVFADLFSSGAYLGSPFSVQPIFVACLAFIHEMKRNVLDQNVPNSDALSTVSDEPPSAEQFMCSIARQNLVILRKAFQRMEQYWSGIAYVSGVLDHRMEGLGVPRINSFAKTIQTFISLPDQGLLRRYTGKNLPYNTAPATDTSLQASIEQDELNEIERAANSLSMEQLFSQYRIRELMVEPADDYDIERLLGAGALPSDGHHIRHTIGTAGLHMQ